MRLPTTKNKILPNARSKPNTRSRRRFPSYTWGASASAAQGANQRPLTARPTITTMLIVITKNIKLISSILLCITQNVFHLLLVQISPCGEVWFEIWLKAHGKIWNHSRRSRVWFQIFPCALKAKSQITHLHRVMFAINITTTSRRVCFNPKRTEKPCALG